MNWSNLSLLNNLSYSKLKVQLASRWVKGRILPLQPIGIGRDGLGAVSDWLKINFEKSFNHIVTREKTTCKLSCPNIESEWTIGVYNTEQIANWLNKVDLATYYHDSALASYLLVRPHFCRWLSTHINSVCVNVLVHVLVHVWAEIMQSAVRTSVVPAIFRNLHVYIFFLKIHPKKT